MKIAVVGATGRQGQGVIRSLLKSPDNPEILGLVRSTETTKAKLLTNASDGRVKLILADLDDYDSLVQAFNDCDCVFFYNGYILTVGASRWLQQVRNAIDAAKATQIGFFVWSNGQLIKENSGVSNIEKVVDCEKQLAATGLRYCILKPSHFMDDFLSKGDPSSFDVRRGIVQCMSTPRKRMGLISCEDIGNAAVVAMQRQEQYNGCKVFLVADVLSGEELAAVASKVRGQPFIFREEKVSFVLQLFVPGLVALFASFTEEWLLAAKAELHMVLPNALTLEEFLLKNEFSKRTLPEESGACCFVS